MATIQTNLMRDSYFDQAAVLKGDYGEILVKRFLEEKGYIVYQPGTMAPHPIDMFVCKDNANAFFCEVKTKPACRKYPETGIEFCQYERYRQLAEEIGLPVYLAFVDEDRKEIYGNYLHELDKPTRYKGMDYPKTVGHKGGDKLTRYFPLCNMLHLRYLNFLEINLLKSFTKNNTKGAA